jgi:chromosome segregation ATPase
MPFDSPKDLRRVETPNGFRARLETPIIDRRVEKSSVNRLKREINSLKKENQNLRQELIELQWQMQQQKMKILVALGESAGTPEGFF